MNKLYAKVDLEDVARNVLKEIEESHEVTTVGYVNDYWPEGDENRITNATIASIYEAIKKSLKEQFDE